MPLTWPGFTACLHVQVRRPGLVMLAVKRTGCDMLSEHSSRQLSLDAALLGRLCSLPRLGSWQHRRRAGSDVVDALWHSARALPSGDAAPWREKGEVKGPLTLPSQTQHCHLKKPKSTVLVSPDNARVSLGVPVDPCHQSHSSKILFSFYVSTESLL